MFGLSSSTSLIVQITLWVLVGFSVLTWAIIFAKGASLWRIAQSNQSYAELFWKAANLEKAAGLLHGDSSLGRIADAGFGVLREMQDDSQQRSLSGDVQATLERSLRQQISKERKLLESGLSVLASIGSTSPFVGLFGTVWGIMHALQDISKAGSASLDVVAGPIGEALVATAIGIAAAIPAVLAYNFFLRRIKLDVADLEYFATDFHRLAVRSALKTNGGS